MARSNYIYVIMHPLGEYPVAAFTVKYEAEYFVSKLDYTPTVMRYRDGGEGEGTKIEIRIEGQSSWT